LASLPRRWTADSAPAAALGREGEHGARGRDRERCGDDEAGADGEPRRQQHAANHSPRLRVPADLPDRGDRENDRRGQGGEDGAEASRGAG